MAGALEEFRWRRSKSVCRLKREVYADFSMKHFHEVVTGKKHKLKLSYTLMRSALQDAGLVEKAAGRGKYRRKRERRPLVGMLVHLDGSTHEWIAGLPMRDLIVALDDADGCILFARFVEQEGTRSTLEARRAHSRRALRGALHGPRPPLRAHAQGWWPIAGRRAGLARAQDPRHPTDSGSFSRGARSERASLRHDSRSPQELRVAGITDYASANKYLERIFVADFNRRFTVKPTESGSAFVPLVGMDLELVLSEQHERVVGKDSIVSFENLALQLPRGQERASYARCAVLVHRVLDGSVASWLATPPTGLPPDNRGPERCGLPNG